MKYLATNITLVWCIVLTCNAMQSIQSDQEFLQSIKTKAQELTQKSLHGPIPDEEYNKEWNLIYAVLPPQFLTNTYQGSWQSGLIAEIHELNTEADEAQKMFTDIADLESSINDLLTQAPHFRSPADFWSPESDAPHRALEIFDPSSLKEEFQQKAAAWEQELCTKITMLTNKLTPENQNHQSLLARLVQLQKHLNEARNTIQKLLSILG